MTTTAGLGLFLLLLPATVACIWDRDTIRDEAGQRPEVWALVSGQIPSHGEAYYAARRRQIEAIPTARRSRDERRDLAVTLMRLGNIAAARTELEALRSERPDEYQTLSNLAVLEEEHGDIARALVLLRQAHAVNPEGHPGVGHLHLQAIEWRVRAATPGTMIDADFRGEPYSEPDFTPRIQHRPPNAARDPKRRAEIEALVRLLTSDRGFADGYFVLGDRLWDNDDRKLAPYAWVRAVELGHPRRDLLDVRLRMASFGMPQRDGEAAPRTGEEAAHVLRQLQGERGRTQTWITAFHAAEAGIVARGHLPAFAETQTALDATGIRRFIPGPPDLAERQRFDALRTEGFAAIKAGDWTLAESRLRAAMPIGRELLAGHANLGRLLEALAAAVAKRDRSPDLTEAEGLTVEALAIYRTAGGPDDVARALRNLTSIAGNQRDGAGRAAAYQAELSGIAKARR